MINIRMGLYSWIADKGRGDEAWISASLTEVPRMLVAWNTATKQNTNENIVRVIVISSDIRTRAFHCVLSVCYCQCHTQYQSVQPVECRRLKYSTEAAMDGLKDVRIHPLETHTTKTIVGNIGLRWIVHPWWRRRTWPQIMSFVVWQVHRGTWLDLHAYKYNAMKS